jgi:AraC-like DNA-binding protein
MYIEDYIENYPIVPYIRESEYAVRTPWHIPERHLLDYLLVFIEQGIMRVTIDGQTEDFLAGEFCLIQPNTNHTIEGLTNTITPFAHFDVFFNPKRKQSFPTKAGQIDLSPFQDLLQPRLNDMNGISIPLRLQPSRPLEFKDAFLRMVESWNSYKSPNNLEVQAIGTSLIHMIITDYTKHKSAPVHTSRLDWMNAYLQLNLSSNLSLEQMAKRANLSTSRFRTLFKEEFGISPHQYLLQLRLNHAIYLLEQTSNSIENIAEYSGFSDIHHFSKAFKNTMGHSPNQYRAKLKSNETRLL